MQCFAMSLFGELLCETGFFVSIVFVRSFSEKFKDLLDYCVALHLAQESVKSCTQKCSVRMHPWSLLKFYRTLKNLIAEDKNVL